jgi:stage III sporulation protein SpoIIIAA
MTQFRITDDLQALLAVLPPDIGAAVEKANHSDLLLEIIMDLGRYPTARFTDEEVVLREEEVDRDQLDYVISRIGEVDADNRAGIERTLHRISVIRNRRGHIVGLTCRVGRAVYGTIDIIQDLIESNKSILLLGRPGVGKTTMLREAARILAESKRVIIVDTSNEIGGDGDVPHPAVGKARRMQVPTPSLQHEVMIEAVENHNPEVIIIDEIGRELEAEAARTIAERGVQLVATAHGRTLENLLLNPTLSDLVGGIESVTLSDEEARRRGSQKTVLERRAPPTFDVLVEIQERDRVAVHADLAASVDALVRGQPLQPEIRWRDESGQIHRETPAAVPAQRVSSQGMRRVYDNGSVPYVQPDRRPLPATSRKAPDQEAQEQEPEEVFGASEPTTDGERPRVVRIYPYGVARNRLVQAAKRLGVPAVPVKDLQEADVVMTLRSYYRERQHTIVEAEERAMPIYVLRSNTVLQMEQSLAEIFNLEQDNGQPVDWNLVADQTQSAIDAVLNGEKWAELPAASAAVRRMQHEMARQAQLFSYSLGREPNRRVRIYRE